MSQRKYFKVSNTEIGVVADDAVHLMRFDADSNNFTIDTADSADLGTELENDDQLTLEKARIIAFAKHAGQVDKAGVDYFSGHLTAVVNGCENVHEKTVAYLHDCIEDTDMTEAELRNLLGSEYGFIVDAIMLLTKQSGVEYADYIFNIKQNPLARAVKISDLTNNSDLSRLVTVTEKDIARFEKYQKALAILRNVDNG